MCRLRQKNPHIVWGFFCLSVMNRNAFPFALYFLYSTSLSLPLRSMQSIHEIYSRLKLKKAERKDLKTSFQDALKNHTRYQQVIDEMMKLRIEKKAIENEILATEMDKAKLEELNMDIKTDSELISDLALTMYVSGEPVEITDDYNVRWVPAFKVTFKKS